MYYGVFCFLALGARSVGGGECFCHKSGGVLRIGEVLWRFGGWFSPDMGIFGVMLRGFGDFKIVGCATYAVYQLGRRKSCVLFKMRGA